MIADGNQFLLGGRHKTLRLNAKNALACLNRNPTLKHASLHIDFPCKVNNFLIVKVKELTINGHMNTNQVDGINHLAKVGGITILPPTNAGFVREPNTAQIGSTMSVAGIVLFKIATHPHIASAKGCKTLTQTHLFRVPAILNHFPGVDLKTHGYRSFAFTCKRLYHLYPNQKYQPCQGIRLKLS